MAQNTTALFPLPDAKGKWGYVDAKKNVKIAYQFMGATPFYEDRAIVALPAKNEDGFSTHVIDLAGKVLFEIPNFTQQPPQMFQMDFLRYSEGLLNVKLGNNKKDFTYLDKEGKIALTIKNDASEFSYYYQFSNGLAYIATSDSTSAYVNKKGEKIIKNPYGMLPNDIHFSDSLAVTYTEKGVAYMNTQGKISNITQKIKDVIELAAMSEGIAFVAFANPKDESGEPQYALLKKDGSTVPLAVKIGHSTPISYVSGYKFSHGLALIRTFASGFSENYAYINKNGKVAFPLPPSIINNNHPSQGQNFHQGLACWAVNTGDNLFKAVYITPAGKIAFESPSIKRY